MDIMKKNGFFHMEKSKEQYFRDMEHLYYKHSINNKQRFKFISLFSGIGGSSLGYSANNGNELLAVEWDNKSAKVFKRNFPDVELFNGDIRSFDFKKWMLVNNIKELDIDILDGSPPCQGFSIANLKKVGLDRRDYVFDFENAIEIIKPKIFIMENVRRVLSYKYKLKFNNYNYNYFVINLSDYGIPQNRIRCFIIGVYKDYKSYDVLPFKMICKNKVNDFFDDYLATRTLFPNDLLSINESKISTVTKCVYKFKNIDGDIVNANCSELKLIQSFPDKFIINENEKKLIGNCVPPLFINFFSDDILKRVLNK